MKATYTRKTITSQDIDTVILNDTYGMSQQENAYKTGLSLRSIWLILTVNSAIKARDWPRCVELIWKNRAAYKTFSWLAERNGIQLPQEIRQEYEKMIAAAATAAHNKGEKNDSGKKAGEAPEPEKEKDPEPAPNLQMSNEDRFFLAVLRHLAVQTKLLSDQNKLITEQNEMLRQLL